MHFVDLHYDGVGNLGQQIIFLIFRIWGLAKILPFELDLSLSIP